jgi:hypothetical protein
MGNTFPLDLARAALEKAEVVPRCSASVAPICTAEQIVQIQLRIKAAMERTTDIASIDKASNQVRSAT